MLTADHVTAAFRTEAKQLAAAMFEVAPTDWSRPTPCPPWDTAELLAYVSTVIAWIPSMLAAPALARAEAARRPSAMRSPRQSPLCPINSVGH